MFLTLTYPRYCRVVAMKRKVEAPKETGLKAPEAPKSEIRQFGSVIEFMVEQMAQRFRNQVFGNLQKKTIAKFEDEQIGNFASIYLNLADKVSRKLVKQFSNARLKKIAKRYTSQVDQRNRKEFYSRIEKKGIGISRAELEATEGLTSQINAYSLETYQWVRKLRDETLQDWTSNTLRMMAEGANLEQIMAQFDGMVEKRRGHAKMVARTQIATFNSLTTKARAQNLGITKARWKTSEDERVRGNPSGKYPDARPSHYWANDKEFDLSEGLTFPSGKTLLPGIDYNCRCDYELIIPGMDE